MKSFITIFLVAFTLTAYCQPTAPILRIETGMHTSLIKRASTDASGKYILTCSEDKTARLWDAENGNLLNTFRIPIGASEEGKIYACALSPDGKIAALGGYTGHEWDIRISIYIINTQTGKIKYTIKELPHLVSDLKFSPDGNLLAAGLGNGELRIHDCHNWNLIKAIQGFENGSVDCLAFDKINQIAAVSSMNKTLKLFDNKLQLIAKSILTYNPYTVCFNDDNSLLAISSYNDTDVVEVRSSKNLSLLYKPEANGFCSQGAVFGSGNNKLYSWGSKDEVPGCRGCGTSSIRIWENYGLGGYKEISFSRNYGISEIKSLPNNKMVLASNFEISAFNSINAILWKQVANLNSYENASDYSHFRINNEGTIIGLNPDDEPAFTFDILNRRLITEQSQFPSYSDNNIIKVTSWNSRSEQMPPYINKIPVTFLEQFGESSRAIDINTDGTEVIFAGVYNLFKSDDKANLIWNSSLPYVPYGGINISGNDKTVACILADGTIRWFTMKDGKEMLALYIDKSKKRWVLFTPSGYYDASPGAEDFLGWHLNNGPNNAPSFYPVSRFKEKYYRPDIIDAIFETYNENDAITLANSRSIKKIITGQSDIRQKLPPTITINSPANGSNISSNSVSISYAINSPEDAPAKNLRVLIDGRPVATERGLKPIAGQKITVTVPSQDCIITLLAENDNGTSPETNLYLKWTAPVVTKDEFVYKPKLYVLAIGVSDYNNPELKLGFAAKDAGDFASAIYKQKGSLYSDVIVKKLTNKEATKDGMLDGLDWIQKQTGQKDVAMIFYAGHGINDNNGVFYMLPVAADLERIKATCLNFEDLKQTVSGIAGKVVVFIDACHSGNVMGSTKRGGTDINAVVNELSSTENGAITFTSSTGKEFSLEDPAWGNGAFTKAVIEGLGGKAVINGKNKITVKSLDAYISERVKELTKGKQHPTSVTPPNVPDFPIAVTQ